MIFAWCYFTGEVTPRERYTSSTMRAPQKSLSLQRTITQIQPFTGLVLWQDSPHRVTDAISLEYTYLGYDQLIKGRNRYDWSALEKLLDSIASRKHQAIIRLYDTYVGKLTTVPGYIKSLPDYKETKGKSEGKPTGFPDWSHPEWQRCVLAFFEKLAARYDRDPRLAFLQVGFGLWAEYHLYDGPFALGKTFPTKAFQTRFLRHQNALWKTTPWMLSIDAADDENTPFAAEKSLLDLNFGLFDDSFLCKDHSTENARNWRFFGDQRWKTTPRGGELSYYTDTDQKKALAPSGPHGTRFETLASRFHLSFMIANDQPGYQPMTRFREASQALGYRFHIEKLLATPAGLEITVRNQGIAPLYYDAYFSAEGKRAKTSLKGLCAGEARLCLIPDATHAESLQIASDALMPGQKIEFSANISPHL